MFWLNCMHITLICSMQLNIRVLQKANRKSESIFMFANCLGCWMRKFPIECAYHLLRMVKNDKEIGIHYKVTPANFTLSNSKHIYCSYFNGSHRTIIAYWRCAISVKIEINFQKYTLPIPSKFYFVGYKLVNLCAQFHSFSTLNQTTIVQKQKKKIMHTFPKFYWPSRQLKNNQIDFHVIHKLLMACRKIIWINFQHDLIFGEGEG